MTGPLGLIMRKLAKEAGKKAGAAVKKDVYQGNRVLDKQYFQRYKEEFASEHKLDIHELMTKDSGVSASWIEKLIENSKSATDLKSISAYLQDTDKTYNLGTSVIKRFNAKIGDKIEAIQDRELLHKLMTFLREHGEDLM